jgi:hypothetical protein
VDQFLYFTSIFKSQHRQELLYIGLRPIDVSDPTNPFEDGFYKTLLTDVRGVAMAGSFAILADYEGLIIVKYTGS